jgi:cytochrome c553
MPEVVAHGRRPDVFACGFCHRAEGTGAPENSALAGLPAAYIVRQTREFKSGARKSSVPVREPVRFMVRSSHGISGDDVKAAAEYFAALRPRANIRVMETDSAPVTDVVAWRLAVRQDAGKEPLGARIVEVPESEERHVSRDPRVTYIAYVPKGSVAKGRMLAESGGKGRTLACATCHGTGLKGMGDIPGISGRSPSYVMRQLYDFKSGARSGKMALMMKPVTEKLTVNDMTALAAYLATLEP